MTAFDLKVSEVIQLFREGNHSLAFRRMTDCVLDTGQLEWYRSFINFYDWKEKNDHDKSAIEAQAIELLEKLRGESIIENNEEKILLDAVNVSKIYKGNRFKLSNISLSIKSGEIIGLVGENGNGKTTLLRILAKDLFFDDGNITYSFAKNVKDEYHLRTRLTYIPQRTPKWYGLIKNNLKFTASHYGITGDHNELLVLMMIIRFGLWPFRNMNWSELSSGYKMRFELARTFLRTPKLLLLDEPLANLDIFAQQIILEDLKYLSQSLRNPLAIVLSSQQLYEVEKISDEVIFLKDGVPKSFNESKAAGAVADEIVFELEAEVDREAILNALSSFNVESIEYNGGTYLISLSGTAGAALLSALAMHKIPVKYFRDITHSTRRFFN